MRRLLALALVIVAALAVLVLGTGAKRSGGGGTYEVRAIFDDAGYLVPGEDVKVAGAKIGTVAALDVTKQKKAVVVMKITDPAFKDFRADANCIIRPQSLIGEKFVECQPTEPKSANARPAPLLTKIRSGDGKGQYLLPLDRTSSPVDVDLIGDVMQMPERQRFALILNELGTGLAGNGSELRDVIRRADPALEQTDKVLKLLAGQNRTLASLAADSDAALAPLARDRGQLGDFVDKAGVTADATAARGDALEANIQKLPGFLEQLGPTAQKLGDLTDQATPVLADLQSAAPSINQVFQQLGPFSTEALPAVKTLGDAAAVGSQALPAAEPVVNDVQRFATAVKPVAQQLGQGLGSLESHFGFNRLGDAIVGLAGSLNSFDSVSHFLLTYLYVGQCTIYETAYDPSGGCDSTFTSTHDASASAASAGGTTTTTTATTPPSTTTAPTATTPPAATRPPATTTPASGDEQVRQAAASQPPASVRTQGASADAEAPLLGYLLGDGGSR